MAYGRDAAVADLKKTFRELAPYNHRYEVFKDFVTMGGLQLAQQHLEQARLTQTQE